MAKLKKCPQENCFWANNGEIYKNYKELAKGLKKMNIETFDHHVNAEKNDFANWIRDVFGDAALAQEIAKAKTPIGMSRKLSAGSKKLKIKKR
jgi:23S rRNA G2069 N7-methylase RlmK/C1962 C5-methylase RlmI